MYHRKQGWRKACVPKACLVFISVYQVRLIKDIIAPHKGSRAQEILERAFLWVKGWYPQCSQLWVCISNQITDRISLSLFPSPTHEISSATICSLRLSVPALPDSPTPHYRLSPQAATCPSMSKWLAAMEIQSKRGHHWGWGVPFTLPSQHYRTHGLVTMAGHTA